MAEAGSPAETRPVAEARTAAAKPAQRRGVALPQVPRWIVYAVGFVPAIWVFYGAFSDQLGADPVRVLEHTLGLWALRFLVACLAVTPLRQALGINLLRYRRALGLLAFYYAAIHFGVYLLLDQGLDWAAIVADIVKRPYLTFGFASFVLMAPLAATSTNAAVRRLGGRLWAKLHRFVYVAAILALLHFIYVMKVWAAEPLIYTAITAVLLGWRLYRSFSKPTPRQRAA